MGQNSSSEGEISSDEDDDYDGVDSFGLLPNDCIATVISSTAPLDACRFAAVSKRFKSVADSDDVWSRFMPPDLADVIARSDQYDLLVSMSKKELFFLLAEHHILIDGGTKSISLDKLTGKKCCCISARDLAITWGDTLRHWKWHSVAESRFSLVAKLLMVWWLEVRGKVKASLLSRDTSYVAYFVFKITDPAAGFSSPAEVSIQIEGGESETRNVVLDENEMQNPMQPNMQRPQERGDGWMEVEVGEFFVPISDEDWEVEMSVMEGDCQYCKCGLVVEGFEVRPKPNV